MNGSHGCRHNIIRSKAKKTCLRKRATLVNRDLRQGGKENVENTKPFLVDSVPRIIRISNSATKPTACKRTDVKNDTLLNNKKGGKASQNKAQICTPNSKKKINPLWPPLEKVVFDTHQIILRYTLYDSVHDLGEMGTPPTPQPHPFIPILALILVLS